MADKILIGNAQALEAKYGPGGAQKIQQAVQGLIAADKTRGLRTQLVDISDAAAMKPFRGSKVTTSTSERQNKEAVDAIYRSARPDYLVILDAPDVIPHIKLDNSISDDDDKEVPSDLPYASDAAYGSKEIRSYSEITRVVGRIPGITAAKTPDFLIGQIVNATNFKTGKRADHLAYFGLSAQVWEKSTRLSVDNIFGKDDVAICPPTVTPAVRDMLASLSHFINCHGSEADPQFYGQKGSSYPVSLTSDDVGKSVRPNTVVAAECCYGAQLFDPAFAEGKLPIPNAYLQAGAAGFFGSTNVAYGPPTKNGAADLITQYFLINALSGASLGRACLQARQRFVQTQKMADLVNLKTLGQFILLADPSIQLCEAERQEPHAVTAALDGIDARKRRRVALAAFGKAVAASSAFATRKQVKVPAAIGRQVGEIARQYGFTTKTMRAYQVAPGEAFGREMKGSGVKPKVVVMTDRTPRKSKEGPKGVEPTRILIAHTSNGHIVDIAEYVNR